MIDVNFWLGVVMGVVATITIWLAIINTETVNNEEKHAFDWEKHGECPGKKS